jgi:hypothetical protein
MTDTNLLRITVNLIPKASDALRAAMTLGRDTQSDTMNRAIQFYGFYLESRDRGDDWKITHPDGETEKIIVM